MICGQARSPIPRTTKARGHELARAHGELQPLDTPNEQPNDQSINGHIDKDKVIQLLENQVADLKGQLEKTEQRENELVK